MEQDKLSWLVHTPAPDLAASERFYRRLGFHQLDHSLNIWQSDACLVELNPDNYARPGVKLFAKDWTEVLKKIKETTPIFPIPDGHLCFSPSGTAVYLINQENAFLKGQQKSLLGNFAGLSLEAADLKAAIKFWEAIGLELKHGGDDKGWISLAHSNGLAVSIMKPLTCPHLFFNPSLTYFNGKENEAIIEKIRKNGVPIAQEVTVFNQENKVDNIILRDPGGYGFFVFND